MGRGPNSGQNNETLPVYSMEGRLLKMQRVLAAPVRTETGRCGYRTAEKQARISEEPSWHNALLDGAEQKYSGHPAAFLKTARMRQGVSVQWKVHSPENLVLLPEIRFPVW